MNLLTTSFRNDMASRYVARTSEGASYIFGGKTTPYVNDQIIEPIQDSVNSTYYQVYDEMLFAKKLNVSDVSLMVRNIPWVIGVVYTQYDDKLVDLEDKNFFVNMQEGDFFGVFKCISNNNGAVSYIPPLVSQTSPTDELYKTSDGYVWKLMYSVSVSTVLKFGTNGYFPLVIDSEVANNAVQGSIDKIQVESPGRGYITTASGVVSQINIGGNNRKLYIQSNNGELSAIDNFYNECAFYVTTGPAIGQLRKIVDYGFEGNNRFIVLDLPFSPNITTSSEFEITPNVILSGDGSGFQGRAIIKTDTDRVEEIEIINRGSNYTNATVSFGINSDILDLETFTKSEARVILPPPGGHGANVQKELFGSYVSNTVDIFEDEVSVGNDFRQIGIIENPTIDRAVYILNSITGLSVGDIVTQGTTTAKIYAIDATEFEVRMADVKGNIDSETALTINGNNYTIETVIEGTSVIDTRTELIFDYVFGSSFTLNETIIQENTNATGVIHQIDGSKLFVTNVTGVFGVSNVSNIIGQQSGTKAIINNIIEQRIQKGSGNIIFIENTSPITRSVSDFERIKIVIGF